MAMRLDHGADELSEVHDKPIYLTLKSDRSLAIGDNPVARERLADVLDAATNGDKEECIFIPADRSVPLRRCRAGGERMRAARYLKVALVGAGNWGGAITAIFLRWFEDEQPRENVPPFKGLGSFKGKWYHTSQWPHEGVDFTAKRVGVIGTGATAVQAIPEIAQQAKHLTVFQRTPNFCVPARNGKVDPEITKARKADYSGVRERIKNSFFGFELNFIPKSVLQTTPEEREKEFDRMWDDGGFGFWLANYQDMFFSNEANDIIADYLKRKIRATVNDPVVAEKLIPKTYPYGTKRQPLDTNYFETFNKKNVLLVDASTDGPIEEITPNGIRAGGKEYPLDIIVIATGFDALTGPLKNLGIKGRGGKALTRRVEERAADLPRVVGSGFPQSLHDYRSAEPFGAFEHACIDRTACRVDYGMHCLHAQTQANDD